MHFIPSPVRQAEASLRSAFSMTELLVVVAVMAALMAVAAPSLTGLNQSGRLTSAGNQLVDLASMARQNAATSNAMSALVVVTGSTDDKLNYKAFCIMECKVGATAWTQVTKWQFFPDGVKVDNGNESAPFLNFSPAVEPAIGQLKCLAKSLPSGSYAYQVFLPDGSMEVGANPALVPVLKVVSERGSSPNSYKITFNPYTGSTKVARP